MLEGFYKGSISATKASLQGFEFRDQHLGLERPSVLFEV